MNIKNIKIIKPQTEEEFEAYYFVRFEILRKPWNHPIGSEKDEIENQCIHAMASLENNSVIGVSRLQFNSDSEAQLCYMGVKEEFHGKGIGKMLIMYLEKEAKRNGAKKMILHSRENAVEFYRKCGYEIIEKSYLLWEEIQHFLMEKNI